MVTAKEYDGNNQLLKITYPSGRVVNYERFPNGQIKNVKVASVTTPVVTLVTSEPFGPPLDIQYGNGLRQARVSDYAGSPLLIYLQDTTAPILDVDVKFYTPDSVGNLTKIQDNINTSYTRDYEYDNLNRLTWDSKASTAKPTYLYDENGNRKYRRPGAYPVQNRYYSSNSNREDTTSYDGMGNTLASLATYQADGRLSSVTDPGTADLLALTYNGFGELARTRQTHANPCNNQTTLLALDDFSFSPDGRALSIKTMNAGSTTTDYIWLDNLPVAQIQDKRDTSNNLISSTVTYLHADHLGTPLIGTTATRQVVWRNRPDAFGIPEMSGTADLVRLRFPGQIALGVAGLNYNYFRDYQPDLGRYVESDPIGLRGGVNTYTYVGNNPLSNIDPLGLYGSQSCNYYAQACAANGGSYECRVASRACKIFPKKQNYFDCARQCLQERHKKRQPEPNSCSADNNIGLGDNAADHAKCLSGCMANPENPYDPKGPDLPDADVDLFK